MFHRKRLQKRPPEIPRIRCEQLALLSRESEMALQTMRESLFDLEEINATIDSVEQSVRCDIQRLEDILDGLNSLRMRNTKILENAQTLFITGE